MCMDLFSLCNIFSTRKTPEDPWSVWELHFILRIVVFRIILHQLQLICKIKMPNEVFQPLNNDDSFMVEDTVYEILQSIQNYLQAQDDISRHLANGIFSMTLARKQKGIFIAKPDDIREDLNASTTLSPSDEGNYSLFQYESNADLLHICALPPPTLRKAQHEFRQSLHSIIQAQSAVCKLLDISKTLSPIVVGVPVTVTTVETMHTGKGEKINDLAVNAINEKISKDEENEFEEEEDDDSDDEGGFENDDVALPEILGDSEDYDSNDDNDA